MESVGFIILRHVNNEMTNKYWIHCYNCIRKQYPENSILIIDNDSNYTFITDEKVYKTTIINSEYPGRRELLPYYYYLHHTKLFNVAVILQDSVFINKQIDMSVDTYKMIWEFEHTWDQIEDETKMINVFNDLELTKFYKNKHLWKGCFGGMSIITHEYLSFVNRTYDISKLLNLVLNKYNGCSFERVIACLLQKHKVTKSLLGNIHAYCPWGITFAQKEAYTHLPIIKCWTGR